MILKEKIDDKYVWQAGPDTQINITNWQLWWEIPNKGQMLLTLDQILELKL
jgi:hypothetical protein